MRTRVQQPIAQVQICTIHFHIDIYIYTLATLTHATNTYSHTFSLINAYIYT